MRSARRWAVSGAEFGTVTGRKRRCGWFDSVLVRQTVITGGIDGIALTKLDVLDGFEEIKLCTGYRLDGREIDYLPADANEQARCEPVYETMEGWTESTRGARSWAELPAQAVKYVRRIEELTGAHGRHGLHQPGAGRHDPGQRPVCGPVAPLLRAIALSLRLAANSYSQT